MNSENGGHEPTTDKTTFTFSTGPLYADKDEYVSKKLIFAIKKIEYQEEAGFENSDRWAMTVFVNSDRPDEIITLQSNDQRDAQFTTAMEHIAERGPIPNVQLVKSGRAYYFRNVKTDKT